MDFFTEGLASLGIALQQAPDNRRRDGGGGQDHVGGMIKTERAQGQDDSGAAASPLTLFMPELGNNAAQPPAPAGPHQGTFVSRTYSDPSAQRSESLPPKSLSMSRSLEGPIGRTSSGGDVAFSRGNFSPLPSPLKSALKAKGGSSPGPSGWSTNPPPQHKAKVKWAGDLSSEQGASPTFVDGHGRTKNGSPQKTRGDRVARTGSSSPVVPSPMGRFLDDTKGTSPTRSNRNLRPPPTQPMSDSTASPPFTRIDSASSTESNQSGSSDETRLSMEAIDIGASALDKTRPRRADIERVYEKNGNSRSSPAAATISPAASCKTSSKHASRSRSKERGEVAAAAASSSSASQPTRSSSSAQKSMDRSETIMSLLSSAERSELASVWERRGMAAGTRVYSEGSSGDSMFIIESGEVETFTFGSLVGKLEKGDFFGELGVVAKEDSGQWDITKIFNGGEANVAATKRNSTVVVSKKSTIYEVRKVDALRILRPNREVWSLMCMKSSIRQRKIEAGQNLESPDRLFGIVF